jgi:carbon-monoxide dehydrogenase small subunit
LSSLRALPATVNLLGRRFLHCAGEAGCYSCGNRFFGVEVFTGGVTVNISVNIRVNGTTYRREIEPRLLLVHFLRDVCGLTGTHVGCETSVCGACTVLVDGQAVKSCTMFAVQADGADITTVEALARDGRLHPVQEGFWQCHGLQCGYCTPGMILAGVQLLDRNPRPTREQIAHGIEGNLCRCTGYTHIIDAIEYAARAASRPAKRRPG